MLLVKMKSFSCALIQYDWRPSWENLDVEIDVHRRKIMGRHRTRRHLATDARIRAICLQGIPVNIRGQKRQERFSPKATGERNQHPDFRLLASRCVRQYLSIVLGHLVLVLCVIILGN